MRVLGIDPGTNVVGYGILEKKDEGKFELVTCGVIKTSRSAQLPERLRMIAEGVEKLIQEYDPKIAAIETPFYGKSVKSAIRIGEGRGAILVSLAQAGLTIAEYAPREVKKAVVGNGSAHKTQVQSMIGTLLGLSEAPRSHDAADALALAFCHCQRLQFERQLIKSS